MCCTQPGACSAEGFLPGSGVVSFLSGMLVLVALVFATYDLHWFWGAVSRAGWSRLGNIVQSWFSQSCFAMPHCFAAFCGWLCPLLGHLDVVALPASFSVTCRNAGLAGRMFSLGFWVDVGCPQQRTGTCSARRSVVPERQLRVECLVLCSSCGKSSPGWTEDAKFQGKGIHLLSEQSSRGVSGDFTPLQVQACICSLADAGKGVLGFLAFSFAMFCVGGVL